MGFGYREAIGEFIYACVMCRPDIRYGVTKISRYAIAPAKYHFVAVKRVFIYLKDTIYYGLIYWRKKSRIDLKDGNILHSVIEELENLFLV